MDRHETPADFWKALAVMVMLVASLYALTLAAAAWASVPS